MLFNYYVLIVLDEWTRRIDMDNNKLLNVIMWLNGENAHIMSNRISRWWKKLKYKFIVSGRAMCLNRLFFSQCDVNHRRYDTLIIRHQRTQVKLLLLLFAIEKMNVVPTPIIAFVLDIPIWRQRAGEGWID